MDQYILVAKYARRKSLSLNHYQLHRGRLYNWIITCKFVAVLAHLIGMVARSVCWLVVQVIHRKILFRAVVNRDRPGYLVILRSDLQALS